MAQHAHSIIDDISVLYELALSIGNSLDLEENCQRFLTTLTSRLYVQSASIWIPLEHGLLSPDKFLNLSSSVEISAPPISPPPEDSLVLIYAFPQIYVRDVLKSESDFAVATLHDKHMCLVGESDPHFDEFIWEENVSGGHFIFYKLLDVGYLKLYSSDDTKFGRKQANMLKNVVGKFATSVQASLNYRRMQHEIDEREKVEFELARAKEIAEQGSQAKSEFLSHMSHELRTPLNSILGFGQLLELSKLNSNDMMSVERIIKAGKHLLSLIEEVLEISRIEAGRISLSLEEIGITQVIQNCVDIILPTLKNQNLSLTFHRKDAEGLSVHADPLKLQQIILNLLSNAVKYNKPDGSIVISAHKDKDKLIVTIADTGLGISKENLAKLFKPFERLGAEQSKVGGAGLGLSLSKGLVEAMDGGMWVESELGEGSRFFLSLPLGENIQERHPHAADPEEDYSKHLLWIEPHAMDLDLVKNIVARRDHITLFCAESFAASQDLAAKNLKAKMVFVNFESIRDEPSAQIRFLRNSLGATTLVLVSEEPQISSQHHNLDYDELIHKPYQIKALVALLDSQFPVEE